MFVLFTPKKSRVYEIISYYTKLFRMIRTNMNGLKFLLYTFSAITI